MKELFKIYSGVFIALFLGFGFYSLNFLHTKSAEAHSIGGSGISGSVVKTGPCVTNFVRVAPNFCLKTTAVSFTALTRDVCTTLTSPSGDAKAFYILISALAKSNNVALVGRQALVDGYNDSGCVTLLDEQGSTVMEMVAIAAGNVLSASSSYMILRNSTPRLKFFDDVGNQGAANFEIRGYWD